MSTVTKIPTVNVVVSFDFDLMREFQREESLQKFRQILNQKQKDDELVGTGFFENTINDGLISLQHTMGEDGTEMVVEFVDPQESFEKDYTNFYFDTDVLATISVDPAEELIREKYAEYVRTQLLASLAEQVLLPTGRTTWNNVHSSWEQAMDMFGLTNFLNSGGELDEDSRRQWLTAVGIISGPNAESVHGLVGTKQLERAASDLRREIEDKTGANMPNDNGWPDRFSTPPSPDQEEAGALNSRVIRLLQQKAGLTLQTPVWISYGIGNDIQKTWSKPTTYGMVRKAEYGFTGDGARVIKLSFGGMEGVGTALSQLGLSPLGAGDADPNELGGGPLMQIVGQSDQLFNPYTHLTLTNSLADDYTTKSEEEQAAPEFSEDISILPHDASRSLLGGTLAEVEARAAASVVMGGRGEERILSLRDTGGRSWRSPSFHIAIRQCMKSYLSFALPKKYRDNVIVLLPNLDPAFGQYARELFYSYPQTEEGYRHQGDRPAAGGMSGEDITITHFTSSFMRAYSQTVAQCGLSLTRGFTSVRPDGGGGREIFNDFINAVGVGTATAQKNAVTVGSLNERWFQGQNLRVTCETDFTTPIVRKLATVADGIKNIFAAAAAGAYADDQDAIPPVSMSLSIETDSELLQAMTRSGLIKDPTLPAVIWADASMKARFLEARNLESFEMDAAGSFVAQAPAVQEGWAAALTHLHLVDILAGVTMPYMKEVVRSIVSPPFNGPFGLVGRQGGSEEYFLSPTESVDLNIKSNIENDRMPVFAFGTKNPNITKVKFDVDNQFTSLLHFGHGITLAENQQLLDSIIAPNRRHIADQQFFEDFKQWKVTAESLGEGEVPQAFKDYVEPHLNDSAATTGGIIKDSFGDWEQVFARFTGETKQDPLEPLMDSLPSVGSWFTFDDTIADAYYTGMWKAFSTLYQSLSVPYFRFYGRNTGGSSIRNRQDINQKIIEQALVGKITTLPMFHLCTTRKVMNRPCLVFAREPGFNSVQGTRGADVTWFTGIYRMYGFEHNISSEGVSSEFFITRDVLSGSVIQREQ